MPELLTIKDIMKFLNCGRKKATQIVNIPSCPKLPRKKGQTFLIPRDAFIAWLNNDK